MKREDYLADKQEDYLTDPSRWQLTKVTALGRIRHRFCWLLGHRPTFIGTGHRTHWAANHSFLGMQRYAESLCRHCGRYISREPTARGWRTTTNKEKAA